MRCSCQISMMERSECFGSKQVLKDNDGFSVLDFEVEDGWLVFDKK